MSGNQNWMTPPAMFEALRPEVTQWGLDAAADERSWLGARDIPCLTWLGPKSPIGVFDTLAIGLGQIATKWATHHPVWLNHPYEDCEAWTQWCVANKDYPPAIYQLVICDPSTAWWALAGKHAAEQRLLRGRVNFLDAETGKRPKNGNNKPSALIVWRRNWVAPCVTFDWDWRPSAPSQADLFGGA